MVAQFKRTLSAPNDSFFLLGPRGTGKSTWIQENIPSVLTIDLLESDRYLDLSSNPQNFRNLCAPLQRGSWIVVDEIQKVPALLDEVHLLYQRNGLRFAISGSSARKLKKAQVNLLAGRLLDLRFFPLTYPELAERFNLEQCLRFGSLPAVANDYQNAVPILASYLTTYLRQELIEEAVIRMLDPFRRFLDIAGMSNGQLLNKEAVGRSSGIKRSTVEHYYTILEDTLIGSYVDSYTPGLKSKESSHPKFYLFDPGVVRVCAGLLNQELESDYLGFMYETFILGQIRAYLSHAFLSYPVFHYSISNSYDIDFVVQVKKPVLRKRGELVCIEVKYSKKFRSEWTKGLRDFASLSKEKVIGFHIVYTGSDRLTTNEGVNVWPVEMFLEALFAGEVV